MAFIQWTDCTNNNLSLEQIIKKWLLVQDENGQPAFKVITANDALVAGLLDKRDAALGAVAIQIKATPGNVLGWNIINPNAYPVYVKFYNKVLPVVLSTEPVIETLMIPSNGAVYQEANCVQHNFSIAIAIAATKFLPDNDTTVLASPLVVNIKYN